MKPLVLSLLAVTLLCSAVSDETRFGPNQGFRLNTVMTGISVFRRTEFLSISAAEAQNYIRFPRARWSNIHACGRKIFCEILLLPRQATTIAGSSSDPINWRETNSGSVIRFTTAKVAAGWARSGISIPRRASINCFLHRKLLPMKSAPSLWKKIRSGLVSINSSKIFPNRQAALLCGTERLVRSKDIL